MYIPRSNEESRTDVLLDFMESHPFGTLVTAGADGLFVTHLPFVLDRSSGPLGTLQGHIARANAHHRQNRFSDDALVIFLGPEAYITPSWYPAKQEHGRVVPTWNYVAVHAHGRLAFVDDADYLRAHLESLTARHEARMEHPWSVADAPAEYIEGLTKAVVGVQLEIVRLEGKWKMSQNRSDADIEGVIEGLGRAQDPVARRVGEIVAERRPQSRPPSA